MPSKASLQSLANRICKEHNVKPIPLRFTDRAGRGLACYVTYRVKLAGKIGKTNYPRYIQIYDWDENKNHLGEIAYRLGHELSHHIMNMKKNSLAHTSTMYNLEENLARKIARAIK